MQSLQMTFARCTSVAPGQKDLFGSDRERKCTSANLPRESENRGAIEGCRIGDVPSCEGERQRNTDASYPLLAYRHRSQEPCHDSTHFTVDDHHFCSTPCCTTFFPPSLPITTDNVYEPLTTHIDDNLDHGRDTLELIL